MKIDVTQQLLDAREGFICPMTLLGFRCEVQDDRHLLLMTLAGSPFGQNIHAARL